MTTADHIWIRLTRKRFISYDWLQKRNRSQPWRIVKIERFGNRAFILCEHRNNEPGKPGDYVVFEQLLQPRAIPIDSYFGSRRAAHKHYRIVTESFISNMGIFQHPEW